MKFNQLTHFAAHSLRMHVQPTHRIPLSMHIVLTNRCNLHCEYCRTHDLPQTDVWTTNSLKDVISEMKECGTRRIHFTGGEPLLRKDIGELIDHAKGLGIFVSIVSNGSCVPNRINELKGVDIIFLSYDGIPEVHRRIRGEKNVGEIKSALKALKEARIKVWITIVLTKLNANRLDEIIDFARTNNIIANFTRLEFFEEPPYHLHPMLSDVEELALKGEERREVFRKLMQLKRSGAPIGSTITYLKNALEWPYDDKIYDSEPSKHFQCFAGRAYGHLEANGMLYSCGTGVTRIRGTSVLTDGFRSAWGKLPLLENCKSCSHACGVESNLIFSLNPSSISNHIANLYR